MWGEKANTWDMHNDLGMAKVAAKAVEMADVKPGMTCVDLGCGSGRLALLLANAARLILRTDERPMTPEAWSRLLRQAGFARVESVDVVAEAAIVKGTKLGTAPNGGA
jgi:cyclopropane fatty-acyl-phospholipid synthase-like methyltransferase